MSELNAARYLVRPILTRRALGLALVIGLLCMVARGGHAQVGPQGISAGGWNIYTAVPSAKMYDALRWDAHFCSQPSYYSEEQGSDAVMGIEGGLANISQSADKGGSADYDDNGIAGSMTTYPTANPSILGGNDIPGLDMKGHFDGRFGNNCDTQSAYDAIFTPLYNTYGITEGSVIGGCQSVSSIQSLLQSSIGSHFAWLTNGTETDNYQYNFFPLSHITAGSTATYYSRLATTQAYKGQTYEILDSESPSSNDPIALAGGSGIGANGDEYWTVPAAGCTDQNNITGPPGGWKKNHKAAYGNILNSLPLAAGATSIELSSLGPDTYAKGDVITIGCGGYYTNGSERHPVDIRTITNVTVSGSTYTITLDKATTHPYTTGQNSNDATNGDADYASESCIIPPGALPPYNNRVGAFALDQIKAVPVNQMAVHGVAAPPYSSSQFPNLIVGPADVANTIEFQQYTQFPPYHTTHADSTFVDADCGFSIPDCTFGDGDVGPGATNNCGGSANEVMNSVQGRLCNMGVWGQGSGEIDSNTGPCGGTWDNAAFDGYPVNASVQGFPQEVALKNCLRGIISLEEWADALNLPAWWVLDEYIQGDGGCSGGFFDDGFLKNHCSSYAGGGTHIGPITPMQVYYELRAFQQYNEDSCVWNFNTTNCTFQPDGFYTQFTGLPTSSPYANVWFEENSQGRVTMWYWRGYGIYDTTDDKTGGPTVGETMVPTYNPPYGNVRGDSAHDNKTCATDSNECVIDNLPPVSVTMSISNWRAIQSIKNFGIDTSLADPPIMAFNPTGPMPLKTASGTLWAQQTPSLTECPQYPFGSTNINGCFTPATTVTPTYTTLSGAGQPSGTIMQIALQFKEYPQALVFQLPAPRTNVGYSGGVLGGGPVARATFPPATTAPTPPSIELNPETKNYTLNVGASAPPITVTESNGNASFSATSGGPAVTATISAGTLSIGAAAAEASTPVPVTVADTSGGSNTAPPVVLSVSAVPTPTATPNQATVTAYDAAVNADSPLAFYPMNDTTGTNMADISGNSNNGSYVSAPSEGKTGPFTGALAVAFDGSQYATTPIVMPAAPFSVEFWANPTGNFGNSPLVAQGYVHNSNTGVAFIDNAGPFLTDIGTGSSFGAYSVTTPNMTVGTWVLEDVTMSAAGAINVYSNGVLKGGPYSQTTNSFDATTLVDLAAYTSGSTAKFDGELSNISVYPTELTASRVSAHYTAAGSPLGYAPTPNALADFWEWLTGLRPQTQAIRSVASIEAPHRARASDASPCAGTAHAKAGCAESSRSGRTRA